MLMQQSSTSPWTEAAVRDTIAAITRGKDYQRALTESLWDRFTRWLWENVMELISAAGSSNVTRTITIVAIAVIVLLVVARIAIGVSAERALRRTGAAARPNIGGAALLADAEALAARGEYTAAAHALFAGMIAACAARGEVRLHASKTTGDYARELRRRDAGTLRAFQLFRARYDRVIYGDMVCSAADYGALAQEARSVIAGAAGRTNAPDRAA